MTTIISKLYLEILPQLKKDEHDEEALLRAYERIKANIAEAGFDSKDKAVFEKSVLLLIKESLRHHKKVLGLIEKYK